MALLWQHIWQHAVTISSETCSTLGPRWLATPPGMLRTWERQQIDANRTIYRTGRHKHFHYEINLVKCASALAEVRLPAFLFKVTLQFVRLSLPQPKNYVTMPGPSKLRMHYAYDFWVNMNHL